MVNLRLGAVNPKLRVGAVNKAQVLDPKSSSLSLKSLTQSPGTLIFDTMEGQNPESLSPHG